MNRYCTEAYGRIIYWDILSLEKALDFMLCWNIEQIDIHIITPFTEY